jgi:hypothetical protein
MLTATRVRMRGTRPSRCADASAARGDIGVYGGQMKRTALVALILAAVSLTSGCWLWPWHHRRTTITASDVRPPPTGAVPVGARQH